MIPLINPDDQLRKQELKSRAGEEETYCFTKSFKELLSREPADPKQEEIEETERWALGSDSFYPDELNDRLISIIEAVDDKNFGRRTVDHTFLEEVMEKKVSENVREQRREKAGMPFTSDLEAGPER